MIEPSDAERATWPEATENYVAALESEIERLQTILDRRPAINAGLPETYIEWSRSIYVVEALAALPILKN